MAAPPDYSDIEDRTGLNLIPPKTIPQQLSNALFDAKNTLAQYNFSPSSMIAEAKRQYQQGQLSHAMTPPTTQPMAKTIR
jgi:hypothetical protein